MLNNFSKVTEGETPLPLKARDAAAAAGFTLLETIIAMLVLMIGMLGLASAISMSLMVSNRGRTVTNSKLLIVSALEQMEMLRNTGQLTYGQIANAGDPGLLNPPPGAMPFNGFPNTFLRVSVNPGPDGIFGTNDDLLDPGPNGIYGDGNDFTNPALAREGFERQILITNLSQTLKRIQVTLRYPSSNGQVVTQQGVSYLNDDDNSNFRF